MRTRLEEGHPSAIAMAQTPQLHLLYSCPFCWKVRGLIEHLDLDVELVGVNGMKIRKEVAFAGDWGKVPVFTDEHGGHHVDSTPLLRHLDATYNEGRLANTGDQARHDTWMEWVDTHMSKATVPILYGSLGSALKTTTRISKLEKFGFLSKRLYAWAGFPIMWGIIARKRVKNDGRKPKQLWHDLLTEFTNAHDGQPFFGGEGPDLVDFAAFGYMRSVSPFPQFSQLEDHPAGMAWYRRMEASLA
jgi:microsomal prostaglandin-E synthase 2